MANFIPLAHRQMEGELVVEVTVKTASSEERFQPVQQASEVAECHRLLFAPQGDEWVEPR